MDRTVRINSGLVRGERSAIQKITVFRGIPYAKAPVGDLRWREPVEADKWDGVRDCGEFGCAAIQAEHVFIVLGIIAIAVAFLLRFSSRKHPELGLDKSAS